MSELRWHPLLEEWVVTATHRQDRTFFPPPDYCPLCPTRPGGFPTEVPASDYEIVAFENKFPAFRPAPPAPAVAGSDLMPVRPSQGICEVVLYSPQHTTRLADLGLNHMRQLVEVWVDRYTELGALPYVDYVFIFENRGEAVGVTLTHPHGQIYAFPFIPPVPAQELDVSGRYWQRTGRCVVCDALAEERAGGQRTVAENDAFWAGVPFYARYPHEVHIVARQHVEALTGFSDGARWELAAILRTVMQKYDGLYNLPLPYMMVMHQAPTDGQEHPGSHFHIEFYPLQRTATKLKFRAGCESGAGTFLADALPEDWAADLRAVPV
jgi:UDPglucose--hexose-1-phosphate uridylyltransferase